MLRLLLPTLVSLGLVYTQAHAQSAPPSAPAAKDDPQEATLLNPIVVTGTRTEAKLEDVPQRIEVVTQKEMEHVPGKDLTDLLKRTSSVDVIQYPGVLSGVGIRGFRPEFSGINQRTLLLVDGRPAMSTNLGMVNMEQVERVEVLKGPASALYGASAMGGVINLITRRSQGPLHGQVQMGLGSFEGKALSAQVGGSITEKINFDYAGSWNNQGDFTMGNGEVRPNTCFDILKQAFRLGFELSPNWCLDVKGDLFRGKDIATPGDIASGINSQSNKDMLRWSNEVRMMGREGNHNLMANVFVGREQYDYFIKSTGNANDLPYLPYKSFASQINSLGGQLQDAYTLNAHWTLTGGLDFQQTKLVTQSWNRMGTPLAPYSADSQKQTLGLFGEAIWTFNGGNSSINLGLRHDTIAVETLPTPLKAGFSPSRSTFNTTSPSMGFRHGFGSGFKLHGTVGRGFVTPDAAALTGESTSINPNNGTVAVYRGNPGLRPESSWTYDLGLGWSNDRASVDCTVFHTEVKDKITTRITVASDNSTQTTYINADKAVMRGIELNGQIKLTKALRLSLGGTHYLSAEENIGGRWRDINNVPWQTLRASLDLEQGKWEGRLGWRFVGRSKDNDWAFNSGRQIEFASFATVDLSLKYHFKKHHAIQIKIENLTNKFYWEKFGYPQSGRCISIGYCWRF